jgi:general stress protein YciG
MAIATSRAITVMEAGRKGGLSLLNKQGRRHFVEIGRKGQESLRKNYPNMASVWGKKGGRPRKNNI